MEFFKVFLIMCLTVVFDCIMGGYIKKCENTEGNFRPGDKDKENICKQLCTNSTNFSCQDSGACVCDKEPTPTTVDGVIFVHCTNWDYVDQTQCRELCKSTGKNDTRLCWTVLYKHYCTCFDNHEKPKPPSLLFTK